MWVVCPLEMETNWREDKQRRKRGKKGKKRQNRGDREEEEERRETLGRKMAQERK